MSPVQGWKMYKITDRSWDYHKENRIVGNKYSLINFQY